jgi:hypothetical protein
MIVEFLPVSSQRLEIFWWKYHGQLVYIHQRYEICHCDAYEPNLQAYKIVAVCCGADSATLILLSLIRAPKHAPRLFFSRVLRLETTVIHDKFLPIADSAA